MENEMLDTYRTYLQSQCSFWSPGNDGYLSGEIVSQWFQRKSLQREMSGLQADLSRKDGVLSGLMYEQKQRLSQPGRNGAWSSWLLAERHPPCHGGPLGDGACRVLWPSTRVTSTRAT